MSDKKFIDGLIVKPPHERAPDYVKAKLSIKRQELIAWLQGESGDWINLDIKESQSGKWYAQVDTWKPQRQDAPTRSPEPAGDTFPDDDIPF